AEKENIPQNKQLPSTELERNATAMLQEAGLADMQTCEPIEVETLTESSGTPLGSLDRTKVSLGDSERTTDSKRFILDQWGTEGTMVKILQNIKEGTRPITIHKLIMNGPTTPGKHNIIAARCFSSVLKLKQCGFIQVRKDPQTLEITDIFLGRQFDKIM
ncbi:unnamed protein product, partial [Parnassius apollo]